eukprot:scaffold6004_cov229-Pinguiococcus_pyrenoidosus.AAC.6
MKARERKYKCRAVHASRARRRPGRPGRCVSRPHETCIVCSARLAGAGLERRRSRGHFLRRV